MSSIMFRECSVQGYSPPSFLSDSRLSSLMLRPLSSVLEICTKFYLDTSICSQPIWPPLSVEDIIILRGIFLNSFFKKKSGVHKCVYLCLRLQFGAIHQHICYSNMVFFFYYYSSVAHLEIQDGNNNSSISFFKMFELSFQFYAQLHWTILV